mgnify:CR=1 FL=1
MMKSIGAKISYVLLLVFLVCCVGIIIVNSKINGMGTITNEISQKYLTSIEEVDAISKNVVSLQSQMLEYLIDDDTQKSTTMSNITKTQGAVVTSLQNLKGNATTDRAGETVNKLEQSYNTYNTQYNDVLKQIQNGSITDKTGVNSKLSKLYGSLEISIHSVEVQNTVNTIRAQKALSNNMTISRITFVTVGVLLVVSLILGILTAGYTIIRPAKIATGELKGIIAGIEAQDGDLTARVSQKSSDEVGQLVAGVNQFIDVLHGIIAEMKNDAVEMKNSVNAVYGQISTADGNIMDVSATMEQLTAGMAEMLVQNHEGYVEFLPCLPVEWKDGSFKGLCLKGGAEATAEWTNAVINKASLKATADQVLKVKIPQGKKYRVLLNSKEAIANPDAKGLITVEMKRGDLLELL